MKKQIAKILAVLLTMIIVFASIPVSAGTHGGKKIAGSTEDLYGSPNGIASKNKKLIKKLKKNAWSEKSNPDSPAVTQSYALYKIYNVFKQAGCFEGAAWEDDIAINGVCSVSKYYDKVIANSKTQKKAITWMIQHEACYDIDGQRIFQGKRTIQRNELAKLIQGAIIRFCPISLEDINTNSSWLWLDAYKDEWMDGVANIPIYKGVIVGRYIDLDGPATKEDLTRALKNLKLVLANRIEPVYRDGTEDESVLSSEKYIQQETEELERFFEGYGIKIKKYGGYYRGIFGSDISPDSYFLITNDSGKKSETIYLKFNNDHEYCGTWIVRGEKIDFVETIKKVFIIRYSK